MNKNFYSIFKTFFKVGTLLLGGGYVILPLLQAELVDKKDWIDNEELCEYYALGQSVPGVIAVNMSAFVGYRLRGFWGALAAILGIVLPSFLAIVVIAGMLNEIVGLKFIQNVFWGVGIGVLMLIFLAVKEMWLKSIVDRFTSWVFFFAFILSACFKVSPAIIIVVAILLGIYIESKRRLEEDEFEEYDIETDSTVELPEEDIQETAKISDLPDNEEKREGDTL